MVWTEACPALLHSGERDVARNEARTEGVAEQVGVKVEREFAEALNPFEDSVD